MSGSFRYTASTTTGEVIEGVVRAGSAHEAINELRRQTLVPVSLEPAADRARASWTRRQSANDAIALSLRSLATLLSAGVTLDRALAFAAENVAHAGVGAQLAGVRRRVRDGAPLAAALGAEAMVGAFGAALVRAGEESGTLDGALARLADHVERVRDLRAQLRSALLYPALMGIVAGVGVLVLLLFVVPRFTALLADVGGTLPWSTRTLVTLSAAVTRWWWLWVPAVALGAVASRQWLAVPANRLRWHAWRLSWPVAGDLERRIAAARYTRALGVLLQSGVGITSAMRLARDVVTNEALVHQLDVAASDVSHGKGIGASLASALPPLASQLIAAGEESGRLPELSLHAAETLDTDAQRQLKSLVAMVEPVLILLFGAVVGFIALALLQAVYSINAGTLQ